VERALLQADQTQGGFHILINNAGIQTYGTVRRPARSGSGRGTRS
jgi:hypothetical protein